jgi:protein-arginine kinase activator protein McsA
VQLDQLREELTQAVTNEQFEEAAKIRDQMRLLESHS